jgi:signal transduction histidine kinase
MEAILGHASFLRAALYLGLAILSWFRMHRRPMAAPFGRLCAALFAYSLAEGMADVTGKVAWDQVEFALAPLLAVGMADLCLVFLAERRRYLLPFGIFTAYFLALAGLTIVGVVRPWDSAAALGPTAYAVLMVGPIVPSLVFIGIKLIRYTVRSSGLERLRGQLMLSVFLIGQLGAMTDLLAMAGAPLPMLSRPAIAISALVLTAIALRGRLLEGDRLLWFNVIVVSAMAVAAQLVVFEAAGPKVGPLALGTLAVTFFLLLGLRPALSQYSEMRARRNYLTTLGRFSAQMAHDLRNPLATMRGMLQFLAEERRRGRSIDDRTAQLDLLIDETRRMERLLDTYQRMGRLELSSREVDLRELLHPLVANTDAWPSEAPVDLKTDFEAQPLMAEVDPELLLVAFENLLRNAWDAVEAPGGRIRITGRTQSEVVEVTVEDDGPGMDPRVRERAWDDFFTTKAHGSGLGLAMARRVAEAHGGSAELWTEVGRGTRVSMLLPRAST